MEDVLPTETEEVPKVDEPVPDDEEDFDFEFDEED